MFLLKIISRNRAQKAAEEIRRNVANGYCLDKGRKLFATINLGKAEFRGQDTDESVFKRAGQALHQVKSRGRNRIETTDG